MRWTFIEVGSLQRSFRGPLFVISNLSLYLQRTLLDNVRFKIVGCVAPTLPTTLKAGNRSNLFIRSSPFIAIRGNGNGLFATRINAIGPIKGRAPVKWKKRLLRTCKRLPAMPHSNRLRNCIIRMCQGYANTQTFYIWKGGKGVGLTYPWPSSLTPTILHYYLKYLP